jgi:hypothetical protein
LRQNSRKNPDLWAPLGSLQGKKRAFARFLGLDGAKRHKLLGACGACGFLRQNSRKNPDLWAPLGSLQGNTD